MADRESFEIALGAVRMDPLEAEDELKKSTAKGPSKGDEQRDARRGAPEPWIVQFHSALAENEVARLRAQFGLRLTEYVPNLAYVEQLTSTVVAVLRDDPLVRAVLAYRPEFKLAPNLDITTTPLPGDAEEASGRPMRLLLFDDIEVDQVIAELTEAGLSDVIVHDDRPIGGRMRVVAMAPNRDSITAAARLPEVWWIEPVAPLVIDNVGAAATIQSGDASNPQIWNKDLHGEKQVIGIIDERVPDMNHCFFRGHPNNENPGPTHRKILAVRNFSNNPPGAHATFVAGCAAGNDIDHPGTAPHRGGAWAAKLVIGNSNDFSRPGSLESLYSELHAAAAAGATIHSNSFNITAGDPANYNAESVDVDLFVWNHPEALVIGGNGNFSTQDPPGSGTQGPPGTAKNAISVSAANADPNELTLCSGASGPTADGRRKPDLAAVGAGIESAMFQTTCDTVSFECATSWAAPHAAAAAALVRQYFTEGWYPTGRQESGHSMPPSGALLKAVLLASTIRMAGPDYPNGAEGFGLIQLHRCLYFSDTGGSMRLKVLDVRNEKGMYTGGSRSFRVEVVAPVQPLKIVLVYSDYPGADGTGGLVNDLNLVVIGPDGSIFLGNHFVNGESATGGTADDRNNVEVVLLSVPQVGTYTIRLVGKKVSRGNPRQGYAVAVLGSLSSLSIGACFVASAVYGNSEHPDVQALRDWRDAHLAPGAPGRAAMRALVRGYALLGPPMARLVGAHPRLATLVRERVLAPFVARLNGKANRRCF